MSQAHIGVLLGVIFWLLFFIELGLFGHEGGVSGFVVLELGVSKLFASVHVESPCPPSESVTFGPVSTSVACLTGRRVTCQTYFHIHVLR